MSMNKLGEKLYSWASILDDNAANQSKIASLMPFVYPHLALMPDAHLGMGATVGSVIPTIGAIIPAAVGVDIGCGMIAVRTQFTADQLPKDLKTLREQIERSIPLSAGHYNRKVQETAKPRIENLKAHASEAGFNPSSYAANWELQLGTLGSGNHFIEVSIDEENRVWLFLHSGSRGVGNRIALHHIESAKRYCKKNWIALPDRDLAYLVEGTPEFNRYISELLWGQEFALMNRAEMMDRVVNQFQRWVGNEITDDVCINCHHNYTEKENHFGRGVWLSRKGAIYASEGRLGLVPGSMGTRSYVVVGKGNKMALNSSPHGAGRRFSRSEARRTFTKKQLQDAMVGIEYRDTDAFIDEIPQAYKDIDTVMQDSKDLIEIKHTLRQIVNVKGD